MARKPQPASSRGEIDGTTGAAVQVSHGHHEIHEGRSYTVSERALALADDGTLVLAFKTGTAEDSLAHLLVSWAAEGKAKVELLEAPTWTTDTGTFAPIICRNREAPQASHMLEDDTATPDFTATGNVLRDPGGLTGGTVLHRQSSFAGVQSIAGARGSFEFVLKASATYAVVMTNEAGSAKDVELEIDWYEELKA